MALFRDLLRSHAELHGAGTPAEPAARSIVALTNDFIARTHGRSNMFATIFFGILDPAKATSHGSAAARSRRPSAAGTEPSSGSLPQARPSARCPGWSSRRRPSCSRRETSCSPSPTASEARSPSGKFYGEDSLVGLLEAAPADVGVLLERIVAGVRAHEAGTEPGDDLTLLAVRLRRRMIHSRRATLAGVITDLTPQSPRPGEPTPFRTEVRILADAANVYFGVTQPGRDLFVVWYRGEEHPVSEGSPYFLAPEWSSS